MNVSVAATPREQSPPRLDARWAGVLGGVLAFAVFLLTNQPYVHPGDAGEFQTIAHVGGIAHAGYPPVVLLLRLFGQLPISTMAFRANLLSCVAGATAVGLAAFVGARLSGNPLAGLAAALALALGRAPWKESTEASARVIVMALSGVVIVLLFRFMARPDKRGAFFIGLAGGLAALSHLSASSLVPVILIAAILMLRRGQLRPGHAAAAVAGLALGFSTLGTMLAADRPNQPMNYIEDVLRLEPTELFPAGNVPQTRLARSAWLLSGKQYLAYPFPPGWKGESPVHKAAMLGAEVGLNEFPFWGIPLALLGAWALWRRRVPGAWAIGVWLVSEVLLTNRAEPGWYASYFFLPGLWAISIGIAAGLDEVGRRSSRIAFAIVALLLVSAPLIRVSIARPPGPLARFSLTSVTWTMWPHEWNPLTIDRSWDEYGRGVMKTLPPRAAIMTQWAEGNPLRYFCWGEPVRPDVHVVQTGRHPGRIARADSLEAAEGREVFATFPPNERTPRNLVFTQIAEWPQSGLWRVVNVDSTSHVPSPAP